MPLECNQFIAPRNNSPIAIVNWPASPRCSACGADFSALANKCPMCGHPSTASQIQAFGCVLVIIGLAMLLFFILVLR